MDACQLSFYRLVRDLKTTLRKAEAHFLPCDLRIQLQQHVDLAGAPVSGGVQMAKRSLPNGVLCRALVLAMPLQGLHSAPCLRVSPGVDMDTLSKKQDKIELCIDGIPYTADSIAHW